MEHSFFVSQNEQDYYSRFACGVASMMMMLSYHKMNLGFSFVQLADELRLAVPPLEKGYKETDPQIGVYPEDVFRFLYKRDIPFRMSFYEEEGKLAYSTARLWLWFRWNVTGRKRMKTSAKRKPTG